MRSMYIHIPFCSSICSYCDFTKMYYNKDLVNKYINQLREEVSDRYNGEELITLYIGGGTPSVLKQNEMENLFSIIKTLKMSKNIEFTFECNINDITKDLITFLKDNGVNRISIGIESFDKDKLRFMERNSEFEDVKNKFDYIRQIGINNINIDLMYAIPNETLKVLKKDLKLFLKLKPTHISTYSLILEDHTKIGIRNTKPIDEELELEMYNYIHYEISNFSLKGYGSIHNINYWNNDEYYGFGLGSHGYIDGIRYENTRNIDKYFNGEYVEKEEIVGTKEKMDNELMLGLRKIKGINLEEFYDRYGVNMQEVYPIKALIKNNDLIYKDGYIFINPDKLYVMNEILLKLI